MRDLFDSMCRGYPIGYLLFWKNALPGEVQIIGTNQKQKAPERLVVDGQQRLTALYAVIKGSPILREDHQPHRIQIAFHPLEERFEVSNSAIRHDPMWVPNISVLWAGEQSSFGFINQFLARLKNHKPLTPEEENRIWEALSRLKSLENYPLTALELSPQVEEEQVAEIFVRINSKGTPLKQADFILTLMSVFWEEGRIQLETFSRDAKRPSPHGTSPYNPFWDPSPDQLLRVSVAFGFRRTRLEHIYSLLRGKDLETKIFSKEQRDRQFTILKNAQEKVLHLQNWHEFMKSLLFAGYRSSSMIPSQMALLFSYALWLIGRYDYQINPHELRQLIARWFFMATLTSRYTGSPEARMDQDLANLRSATTAAEFKDILEREMASVLTEDYWRITLPNELATAAARSPALLAFYAAQVILEAPALFSNLKVTELLASHTQGTKKSLEKHHLFPRKYLKRLGIQSRRDINQVANYALVEWHDNIAISDQPPQHYVPDLEARFTPEALKRMYHLHALPSRWYKMDYFAFLEERRRRMAGVIREAFAALSSKTPPLAQP